MSIDHEQKFDSLISHLKTTANLDSLEKEDKNLCTILSNDFRVSLLQISGELLFSSTFTRLQNFTSQKKIKDFLLQANTLYLESRGGTFGMSDNGSIYYCFQYPLSHLSEDLFITILDNFIQNIEDFNQMLKDLDRGKAATESTSNILTDQSQWQRV